MTSSRLAALVIVVVLMSAGQILFKQAATRLEGELELSWHVIWRIVSNLYLIAGLFVYGVTTILWVLVLAEGDLSRSYPFVALTMAFVPVAGILIFGEAASVSLAIGSVLIIAGLAVIAYG